MYLFFFLKNRNKNKIGLLKQIQKKRAKIMTKSQHYRGRCSVILPQTNDYFFHIKTTCSCPHQSHMKQIDSGGVFRNHNVMLTELIMTKKRPSVTLKKSQHHHNILHNILLTCQSEQYDPVKHTQKPEKKVKRRHAKIFYGNLERILRAFFYKSKL